jgi:hypothetical protein
LTNPRTGYPEEYVYFVDSPRPLQVLCDYAGTSPDELDFDRVSHGHKEAGEGRALFIRHELMISRLRAMLELACRSRDDVELIEFKQGAELKSSVELTGYYSGEGIESVTVWPDAFFTLYFPQRPEGRQYESFIYEADRKTMDTSRMTRKLAGLFHFIVKRKLHRHPPYEAQSIRAVLVETLDTSWAETLRHASRHPAVSGPKPSNLFWFTSSEFFTKGVARQEGKRIKQVPLYQEQPSVIFSNVWFSPNDKIGDRPRSILDP